MIHRSVGVENADLYNSAVAQSSNIKLREPEKLSLNLYMQFNQWCVAAISEPYSDKFMLLNGKCCAVTESQIAAIEKHMNSGNS